MREEACLNNSNIVSVNNRSSYIDIVSVLFAIMIVLFHYGKHVLPGGRIAVEGFFMISGYLMMNTIEKQKYRGGAVKK